MARVAVVGLWHLGCVVATGLARLDHVVAASDSDNNVVRRLQQGEPPIYEPGLADAMAVEVRGKRLSFHLSLPEALADAEYIFITLDTPVDENDESDLRPIESAVEAVATHAQEGAQLVVMSQVPVGTCRLLAGRLKALRPQFSFSLVYQPENLRLGQALEAFLHPDVLVVGAEEPAAAERLLRLYEQVQAPRLAMSWASAEMAKHGLNAYLATSVSFSNELAELAAAAGADIRDVVSVLRTDRRIGPAAFLSPGPGFSGGTLARDVQTLRKLGKRLGPSTRQLDATLAVNSARLPEFVDRIRRLVGTLAGASVGLLGLTYKPGTNTLRRSHSLALARLLRKEGCIVRAYDPQVLEAKPETNGIAVFSDPYKMAEGVNVLVVATPWPQFRKLDLARLRSGMGTPVLFDGHNFLDPLAARTAGFRYCGVGIPEEATTSVGAE